MLSDKELDTLHDVIVDSGVSYESLQNDLIDHLACIIEAEIEKGLKFKDALQHALAIFSPDELKNTNESTIYLLTLKSKKMKKTTGIIGIAAAIAVLTGTFFKVMHWPGASILLVIGLIAAAVIVLPMMANLSIQKSDLTIKKAAILSAYAAGIMLTLSGLFKIQHWPLANVLNGLGFATLCLVFAPLYLIGAYRLAENRLFATSKALLIIAGGFMLWALMPMKTGKPIMHQEKEVSIHSHTHQD